MNHIERSKTVAKVVDTNAAMAHAIDCLGYNHASIDVSFEAGSTAAAVASVLKLQQSDTNGSFADVSGFVGGTDFTIPTPANTTDSVTVRMDIDLRGRKRYLNVAVTPSAQSGIASVVRLSRPDGDTEKGANVAVSG